MAGRAIGAAAGLLALSSLLSACSPGPSAAPPSTTQASTAPAPTAPSAGAGFRTSGNQILTPTGAPFAPTGFVLECLAMRDLSCEQQSASNPLTDPMKIQAAASFWQANTVRLQVAQEQLFSQSPYDSAYLQALDNEVNLANSLGLVAVVTLQEEDFQGPPFPTASAERFWTFMAAHFKNSPGVFFDLYNEPKLDAYFGESWLWNIWRNGGHVDTHGINETFVGMQTLVDEIRRTGATNLIVAESNKNDHDLSQVMSHLLTGNNIAYAFEPNLKPRQSKPKQWNKAFGNVANHVPLVMDAFRDYATGSACFRRTPVVLPHLTSYLERRHLGMLVWTLEPGNTIVGSDLEQPTSYQGTNLQLCVPHNRHHQARPVGLGATYNPLTNSNGPGADILAFFQATSHPLPPGELQASG